MAARERRKKEAEERRKQKGKTRVANPLVETTNFSGLVV